MTISLPSKLVNKKLVIFSELFSLNDPMLTPRAVVNLPLKPLILMISLLLDAPNGPKTHLQGVYFHVEGLLLDAPGGPKPASGAANFMWEAYF